MLADVLGQVFALFLVISTLSISIVSMEWKELKQKIFDALQFLLPVLLHVAAFTFLNIGDRLILQQLSGSEAVAKYTVAYMLGMSISIFHDGLLKAWNPYFYSLVNKSIADEARVFQYIRLYSILSLVIGIIFGIGISNLYTLVMPDEYNGLGSIIMIISIAYSFEGVRKVYCGYLYVTRKTKYIANISLGCMLINILMNLMLIPFWGILGAAVATLISFLLMMLLTIILGRNSRNIVLESLTL